MRVLIVSQMYPRHEAPTYAAFIQRQAAELVKAGAEVTVLAPMMYSPPPLWFHERWRRHGQSPVAGCTGGVSEFWPRYLSLPGMRFHFVEGHTIARALKREAKGLKQGGFDVIHANRLFPEGLAAMTLKSALGIPLVAMARGMDLNLIPSWGPIYQRAIRSVVRGVDGILSVSRALLDDLERIEPPTIPKRVIYNGVDPVEMVNPSLKRALRRELGLPEEGVIAAYVGRLEPDKGTPELLRAMAPLARMKGVHLAAIGEIRRPSYREDVARAGWQTQAHFLGARPREDVEKLLRASDLFVFPSRLEGVPNAVLEAMSAGLPVVATAAGGVREILPGHCGIVVDVGDVRAIGAAIEGLIDAPDRRRQLGKNARAHIENSFTWAKNAEGLLGFYEELMGARQKMQARTGLAA